MNVPDQDAVLSTKRAVIKEEVASGDVGGIWMSKQGGRQRSSGYPKTNE